MKYILFVLLAIALSVHAQDKNQQLVIKGTIHGDNKGFTKVYCYGEGIPKGLVQEMKNDTFEFILQFEQPIYPLFYTEYDRKVKNGYVPFGLPVDKPGAVNITIENIDNGFNSSIVTGLQTPTLYQSFNSDINKADEQIAELLKKQYGASRVSGENPHYDQINKTRDSLMKIMYRPLLAKFIAEHSDTYAGIVVLKEYKTTLDVKDIADYYGKFTEEMKNSIPGKSVADYLSGFENSQIGSLVKNFTLMTNEDKPFDFAQLKGKYIVLDFWASWCGACRQAFPHMREIYGKYKDKEVAFVNISIDTDKAKWLAAVAEENNPWTQLLNNDNVAQKLFGETAIPITFLIDKEGKIIAKELGYDPTRNSAIENELKRLLGF